MKNLIFNLSAIVKITSMTLLMLLVTKISFAQQNIITITPIPTTEKFTLSYERGLNESTSIVVNYQNWFVSSNDYEGLATLSWAEWFPLFSKENKYQNKGHRLNGEYRKYFSTKNEWANGFYGGLNVFGGFHKVSFDDEYLFVPIFGSPSGSEWRTESGSESVVVLGGGISIGYQKQIKRFVINVNTLLAKSSVLGSNGLSIITNSDGLRDYIKPYDNDMNDGFVKMNLSIGMAF